LRLIRVFRQRARSLFRSARADAELAAELAFHLEQLTRENIDAGMAPGEARAAARRILGGVAWTADQCRDTRRLGWLMDFLKDLAYAARMLRKSPGFTALAVVTLALGVGASIAVYALSEALLLRSLPFPAPERLVAISDMHVRRGESGVGQANFRDWQTSNTVFERMAYTEDDQATFTGNGEPERIGGRAVSEGFFELLGVAPELGRWFTPEEQKPGVDCVVMLSRDFWRSKLGGRPEAIGATIFLNDRACRITGVMPAAFRFNEGDYLTGYWTPIGYRNYGRQQHQYSAYARLKPGVTVDRAQAQMTEIARRLEKTFPDNAGWGVRVVSLRGALLRLLGPALMIFAAAALIVLLVACANVASLLLARGVGRSKEIAVRIALGAGRRRVVRLLLAESLLLSCLGALAGVVLAALLVRLAAAAAPPALELGAMLSVGPTIVGFSVALTLATGVLTGLWPALRGSRANVQDDLKESGNSLVAGRRQGRSLNCLVAAEIALALVLLTFAGLLAKSFSYLLDTSLGYRTDRLLSFRMPLPGSRYRSDQARLQFWDNLLPRLSALPGVVSAAAADGIPLGGTMWGAGIEVEGDAGKHDWADVTAYGASVTPDYFRTMGISLTAGREFARADTAASEPVAMVNQAFVRKMLPGRTPLDTRVRFSGGKWQRIVGVIGDIRYAGPAEPVPPQIYAPYTQDTYLQFVVLHTAAPEEAVLSAVRQAIKHLDAALPVTQVRTMRQSVDMATSLPREMMLLVLGFATVALAMSTLGLSGVMAYAVSRRTREIGLRMALGARAGDISRAVIGGAARLVLAGLAVGLAMAFAGVRLLESLLYGVRPHDPVVMFGAPVLLAAIALAACLIPARRAASVEPMTALRQE
jgi:putative ABC transport system permease protein